MAYIYQELLTDRAKELLTWLNPAVKMTHDLQAIDAELHDLKKTGDEYDEASAEAVRNATALRTELFGKLAWYRLKIMDLINATDFRTADYVVRERTAVLIRHVAIDHFVRGYYVTSSRGDYSIMTKYNLSLDTAKRLYRAAVNRMAVVWDGSKPKPP